MKLSKQRPRENNISKDLYCQQKTNSCCHSEAYSFV